MKKKILHLVAVMTLLLTVVPVTVSAAITPTVTVNEISGKKPSNDVNVTGTSSTLDLVNIKVINPDDTILVVASAAVTSGSYSYSFALPSTAAVGTYTVVVGQGSTVATTTIAVTAVEAGSGGGEGVPGGTVTPPTLPTTPAAVLENLQKMLDNLFAELPANSNTPPKSDNKKDKDAGKAAEKAVKDAGKTDVSKKVTTNSQGVAQVTLTTADLVASFKNVKEVANTVDAKMKEKNENAAPVKIVANFDLGTVAADNKQIPISKEQIQAAKDEGIDAISFTVNGLTMEIDLAELEEDTVLNIDKVDNTSANDAIGNKNRASDVYSFEFTNGNGQTMNGFNKPIQISIPVNTDGIVDAEYLVLVKIVDGKIIPYGGTYNEETGNFEAERNSFSTYTVIENKVEFTDIASVQSWAGKAITVAAAKGIINGRGEGSYVPQGNITRAEFATLIVKAFGLENDSLTENFTDVADGAWYQAYVAAAVNNGIINGRSATIFDPNANISRAEMATMGANALKKVLSYSEVGDVDSALSKFTDANKISPALQSSVALMTQEGIINGKGEGIFDPSGKSTRAEAAVIIYQLFNLR